MKRRKKLLLVIPVAVAAFVAFQRYRDARIVDDPDVIRVSGNIEVTDAEVSFKIAGRVQERLVSEGEIIEAGQLAARLDSQDLAQEVALRKAEVQLAQAVLDELEAGSRPEEIAQAAAAVASAGAELERLRLDHSRQRELHTRQVIADREYEVSKAAYEMAQGRLKEVQEQLELARKGPRREKIEQARAGLQLAREALGLAETRLSYATLVSPLTGVVLSDSVEPGEYVAPGTPVVTVGDLEHAWLRAYINETDLGRVKVGQRARVATDTYPGKTYDGRVSFISSQAEFTPKNVQTEKERVKLVYRVKIDIPNPAMELKPGMPADADILTAAGQEEGT
ncbi:MAG: efflux RND transporter periplasmic adaptor subunit [bacterium]